jgi:hypothetical protein
MNNKNFLMALVAFVFVICVLSLVHVTLHTKNESKVEETFINRNTFQTCNIECVTNDGVICEVIYKWVLDLDYTEVDQFKINCIISRIIKKNIFKHSLKDLFEKDQFMSDLIERTEDSVFSLYPTGFNTVSCEIQIPNSH